MKMFYLPYLIIKKIILRSFRRRKIDKDLKDNIKYFQGKILDIGGGRKRGNFSPPNFLKKNWLVVDIDKNKNPDVVGNVEKLPFKDSSFDTIKATELFEHVENIEEGLRECLRVLKKGGYFIISLPFLSPIHADPADYQRVTEYKLTMFFKKFKKNRIVLFKKQGLMFSVIADMLKSWIIIWPSFLRYPAYLLIFPMLEFIVWIENFKLCSRNEFLNKHIAGYFLVLQKM